MNETASIGQSAQSEGPDVPSLRELKNKTNSARAAAPPIPLSQLVAEHPFLHGMSPPQLAVLADAAMRSEFKAGELIFREGDPANRFYLIQAGQVALESPRKDGVPIPIQTIGAGDVLGWSWLFPPYYWHFDARALEPVKAIFFYGTRLREQSEADRHLGYELLKRMAAVVIHRLQATRQRLLKLPRPS